jgi:hypothetical protein
VDIFCPPNETMLLILATRSNGKAEIVATFRESRAQAYANARNDYSRDNTRYSVITPAEAETRGLLPDPTGWPREPKSA